MAAVFGSTTQQPGCFHPLALPRRTILCLPSRLSDAAARPAPLQDYSSLDSLSILILGVTLGADGVYIRALARLILPISPPLSRPKPAPGAKTGVHPSLRARLV